MEMNKYVKSFVEDIITIAPTGDKNLIIKYVQSKYKLIKDRSVYYCSYFAVRFCYTKNSSFSNTVLSLSHLQKFDKIPFFVILVRNGESNLIFLSNSTFLSKISHSSQDLSLTNIKGSFNGSDIIKEYDGLKNSPEYFDELFALHCGLDWEDNLSRLVEMTAKIKPISQKFYPNAMQIKNLFQSIDRAASFISSKDLFVLNNDLNVRCNSCKDAIMIAAHIENVNIRGRLIEYMITADEEERSRIMFALKDSEQNLPVYETKNDLGDYTTQFENSMVYTDIKTKILYLDSSPKAYNIDKFLEKMSESDSVFLFYFIGIGDDGTIKTLLCSVYHEELLNASIPQHHWSGRATRGVIQFNGKTIDTMLNRSAFSNVIDIEKATKYIEFLLNR